MVDKDSTVKINSGFERMPPSYLFRDVGQATGELKARLVAAGRNDDIIKIGIGDPDMSTPYPIVNELSNQRKVYRGYPDYDGLPELRTAISDYYAKRFGIDVPSENILIGDGAKSDLTGLAMTFLDSQQRTKVVLQDPAYPVYENWSRFSGAELNFMNCTPENDFFGDIPKGALDEFLSMIWLCNPNNPTGAVASKDYLTKVVQQAKEVGATLVHDIAYTDFRPGGEPPYSTSIFNLPGAEDVAVEIGSFSKPFSMTGDRLSWVAILDSSRLDVWKKFRSNADSGVPEYIQLAGVEALTNPVVWDIVDSNMREYGKRAAIIREGFESIGCGVYGLDHAPYGWIKVPEGYSSEDFSRRILDEAHVVTIWGSGFGKCGEGFIRTTVFQDKEKLEEAVERIGRINW
jgi:LL-diaminopimelate aminotransferase